MRGRTYTSGPFCAAAAGEPCSEKSATYSSPSAFSNSCRLGQHRWAIRRHRVSGAGGQGVKGSFLGARQD